LFSNGLFGEPGRPFVIEFSDQPPALSAAIAVIQIDLEDIPFCIFNHKIATVPPRVPFTAARWKAAEAVLAELSGIRVKKIDIFGVGRIPL
jgi:hypothetical protein